MDPPGTGLAVSLGMVGQGLPGLDTTSPARPVYLLADYSGRLAPEAIEPRGWAGGDMGPAAGNRAWVQLQSKATGGIVIESFLADVGGAGGSTVLNLYRRVVAPFPAGAAIQVLPVGGGATRSTVAEGQAAAAPAGDAEMCEGLIPASLGWFIPPGWFFAAAVVNNDNRMRFGILWRELLDVQPGQA